MAVSKVLSIEITDALTKICEVSYNKKNPVVYRAFSIVNPEGSVMDGFIVDRGLYGSNLKEQLEKEKIKCKDVVFVLEGTKVMSREAVIPEMKDELIQGFIQDERDEYFPMDTSEYLFSYSILERNKEEHNMRIMIYAAQEILIKNLVALTGELELRLQAIDYEGNAIYQWQKKPYHEPISIYLQINIRNSLLSVMENGVLSMQRNMAFGIGGLMERLMASGYYEDISPRNAIDRLCEKELMYSSYENMNAFCPKEDDDDENRLHAVKCSINEAVRPLIENVTRALEFYGSKSRDAVVEKIYIGGIGAEVKNLRKLLQSEFIGVEFIKVLDLPGIRIHKDNPMPSRKASEYIGCIAASELTINFYEANDQKKLSHALMMCMGGLVIAIVAAIFMVYNGKSQYRTAINRRDRLQAEQNALEATGIEELEARALGAATQIQELKAWDDGTYRYNEMWNDVLECLEKDSTENMLVSSVSSSDSGLSMNITVNSKEEAAKLIEQLRYIPYFSEIQVYSVSETEDTETGRKTVSFTALCIYKTIETEEEGAQ
ncbi:MAG: pilus assembly protein PilM [Lachnospiraceae bacterium]|nr:pilus assembly protein PilM [Lachnospiraceae bacterium]